MQARKAIRVAVLATTLAWAGTATAQSITGQVVGVVTDGETGKPIAGATVTATSPAWIPQSVTTDSNGFYAITLLPPERYTVTARAPGFSQRTTPDVPVMIDWRVRANMPLSPAQAGRATPPPDRVAAR
jgi:hypothetical protein